MHKTLIAALICLVLGLGSLEGVAEEVETISVAEMALGFYQPLAEQGEPYAQLTIGEIYMEGSGVAQDLVQAYAWFVVASEQGVEEAGSIMNHVLKKLSEAEQVQAKALAKEFVKAYSVLQ